MILQGDTDNEAAVTLAFKATNSAINQETSARNTYVKSNG